ncbi:MAG: glycosyltransferase [Chloroflexi bacterium]|nr:glycosyltransferase [Chloroflexota bacterium]
MHDIIFILAILYAFAAISLAIYGFNALLFSALFVWLRRRETHAATAEAASPESFPSVTIQLPIFNERFVVERLIKAVAAIDYPRQQLSIQVLDDSTDDTATLSRAQVAHYKAQGVNIDYVRRPNRTGYKAGALAYGLEHTPADFVAVFDADFVPPRDFLQKVMPSFANERVGLVQARWGHLNPEHSWLTMSQALMLDGHFGIEQFVRSRLGLMWNFNGSAGVWRVQAIKDSGGWGLDTVAEDLDLSYRAQLRGWQMRYLSDVVAPAEIPSLLVAFKRQQFRWAKGSIQCLRKFARPIIESPKSLFQKAQSLIHLSGYLVHPLILLLSLISLPLVLTGYISKLHLSAISIAGFGAPILFAVSQWALYPNWKHKLRHLPTIILIGPGIAVSNSWAVIEALINRNPTLFLRTPKFQVEGRDGNHHSEYSLPVDWSTWVELFFMIYSGITTQRHHHARLG